MSHTMTRRECLAAAVAAALAMGAGDKPQLREPAPWSLYAFDNGLNGPDVPTVASKVALLRRLGYNGMTDHFNLNRLPQVLDGLDAAGLEFASLYYTPPIEGEIDPKLQDAIKRLQGRRARIEIGFTSRQFKPSDPAADSRAVDALKRIADWCGNTGPVISIYPHKGFWTQRVEDGLRLAKQVGLKTVGTNFNLVHWKWVPQPTPLADLLAEAMPHLMLLTINGLEGEKIVPLSEGDFDVAGFLAAVKKAGYSGPIGLQCYNIPGPSEDHLSRSMGRWKKIMNDLRA